MIVGLLQIKKKGEKGYPTMVTKFLGLFRSFQKFKDQLEISKEYKDCFTIFEFPFIIHSLV